ncbi:MAG: type II toxin-antitoxin system HicB family antitoxin [Candidatus Margulisbacteria bacterium]|jgi:antitoxin HicB|nr:type II toxin-antitoxin system HicB family antitoxin [Candidatus Margulisiibacteriota bacterium]
MNAYPARIWKEANNSYSVEFPDLPGCLTCADTYEEAVLAAHEALNGYLESLDSRKLSIPAPSRIVKNMVPIKPSLAVSFAITLKQEREKRGLTQKEVARQLGVNWSAYQRIENPRRTNPTLTTVEKLQKVFGAKLLNFTA